MPTRRLVLTAALATGAVTACTDRTPVVAPPPADPDADLVAQALAAESAVLMLIDSLVAGRPRRTRELAGTRSIHQAHVQLLTEAAPSPTGSSTPPAPFTGDDRAAYRALAQAEDRTGQALRQAAYAASSGPFARVLAGMAAAAAQQSARLRTLT